MLENQSAPSLELVYAFVLFLILPLLSWMAWFLVQRYQNPQEKEPIVTRVTMLGLTLTLMILALLPLDIYLTSMCSNDATGLSYPWATPEYVAKMLTSLKAVYYGCFILVVLICLFVVPFAYFYFEEQEEIEQLLLSRVDNTTRAWAAFKYTCLFASTIILMFIALRYISPSRIDLIGWESLMNHVVADLMLLGLGAVSFFTGFGLAVLPFCLIRKKPLTAVMQEDEDSIYGSIAVESPTTIRVPIRSYSEPINPANLMLRRRLSLQLERSKKWKIWLGIFLRPFEIIMGVIFLIFSLIMMISVFLVSAERFSKEKAEWSPIDLFLSHLAEHFPLDYFLTTFIIFVLFVSTVHGLVRLGIRFLWVPLFTFKKRQTDPQALLLGTVILMVALVGLAYTLSASMAPRYIQYGGQRYCSRVVPVFGRYCGNNPELIIPCDENGPKDICIPTMLSSIINQILLNTTTFHGELFYWLQWGMLFTWLVGMFWDGLLSL